MNTFNVSGSTLNFVLTDTFSVGSSSLELDPNLYSAVGSSGLSGGIGGMAITASNPSYSLIPVRPADSFLQVSIQGASLLLAGVSIYKYRPVFLAPGSTSLIRLQPLPTLNIEYPRTGQIFPLGDGTEYIQI